MSKKTNFRHFSKQVSPTNCIDTILKNTCRPTWKYYKNHILKIYFEKNKSWWKLKMDIFTFVQNPNIQNNLFGRDWKNICIFQFCFPLHNKCCFYQRSKNDFLKKSKKTEKFPKIGKNGLKILRDLWDCSLSLHKSENEKNDIPFLIEIEKNTFYLHFWIPANLL
jgi:hypothetical protein